MISRNISRFALYICLVFPAFLFGQGGGLDAEIGFQYVKAEYLFETNRFEECIQEYNQVIAKNPGYKDALVKRATAKYNLAAYKGAKQDALQAIDLLGITSAAAFILGKSELAMGNDAAATPSISAAIALNPQVDYLELRAGIYEKSQELLKACQDYNEAARLGSALGEQKSRQLCGGYSKPKSTPPVLKPKTQPQDMEPQTDQPTDTNNTVPVENENNTEPENEDTSINDAPVNDPTVPGEDDFVQGITIDEELSIDVYGQGLGRRKITTTPSILIIADESGNVTLDICVNNLGEVTKAEFNAEKSTIAKKSMVNLALRKAKEFTFEKSVFTNQCGYMVFKVKAN